MDETEKIIENLAQLTESLVSLSNRPFRVKNILYFLMDTLENPFLEK